MLKGSTIPLMDIKQIIRAGGGPSKLGAAVGRKHSSVIAWTRVPAEHAATVERVTGIPRHVLRPDLWDVPAGYAPASPAQSAAA